MNKKSIVYILLMLAAGGLYYYQQDDKEAIMLVPADLSSQPAYQSNRMQTMIYNPSGYLNYKIIAHDVKHFDFTGNTDFSFPKITLYQQENQATWNIKADQATLATNKLLYLNNNIQLNNLLPDAQLQKITTNKAKVDLTTQIVTSDDKVTIQGAYFNSTGIGLDGNLRNKTANILEDVKTYYNTNGFKINNSTN